MGWMNGVTPPVSRGFIPAVGFWIALIPPVSGGWGGGRLGHPPPQIDVRLTAEPIPPSLPSPPPGPSCGVVLEFRRIARQTRDGGPMRYVVYEKMALSKMTEIATALNLQIEG